MSTMVRVARRLAVLALFALFALTAANGSAWVAPTAPIHACEATERVPRLETYTGIAPGNQFYVDARLDNAAGFVPIAHIDMPLHHSSRLQWTNLDKWPSLLQTRAEVFRFRFRVLAAKIEKVPAQNRWWATYDAEIEDICIPPLPESDASPVLLEGKRCALASPPAAASPTGCSDEATTLKASVSVVREHGCSQSTESTASLSEFALELRRTSARLAIETFDSTSFGPSRGAFQAGRRDFTRDSVRWRRIYTGSVERSGGNVTLHFDKLETAVDRRGGIIYSELKKIPIAQTIHCAAGGVVLMPPLPEEPSSSNQQPFCAEALLCRGMVELAPIPGSAAEALEPIAPRVLVGGRLPLRGSPGIEIRAKDFDGRELTSFRQPR